MLFQLLDILKPSIVHVAEEKKVGYLSHPFKICLEGEGLRQDCLLVSRQKQNINMPFYGHVSVRN